MTLVVARRLRKHVWIAADTKISDPKLSVRSRELQLKLFSLPGGAMAAYSGCPEIAHEVFESVSRTHADAPLDKIAELAHRLTEGTDVEFIMANEGILVASKDRNLAIDVPNAWIGSQPAFNSFQRYLFERSCEPNHTQLIANGLASTEIISIGPFGETSDDETSLCLNMHAALWLVGCEPQHDSVGGEVVLAHSSAGRSGYVSFSTFVPPRIQTAPSNRWNTINFGNAANGGYSFTTIVPEQLTYPSVWGVFRHQAGEGRLFIADPLRSHYHMSRKRASSAAHFCAILKREHGITFTHCGSHKH